MFCAVSERTPPTLCADVSPMLQAALEEQQRLKQRMRVISTVLPLLEQQVEHLRARPPQRPAVTIESVSDSPCVSGNSGGPHSPVHSPSDSSLDTANLHSLLAEPYFQLHDVK